MRITLDRGQWDQEQLNAMSKRLWVLRECQRVVKAVSFEAERSIKDKMPKDTGRATSSWGHFTIGDIVDAGKANASPQDAVWKPDPDGLGITQGTNVPYVEQLNAGSSRQAPAGFIDTEEDKAVRALNAAIDEIMRSF